MKPNSLIVRWTILLTVLTVLGAAFAAFPAQSALAASTCRTYYVVRAGDTLAAISKKYDAKVEDMAKANKLYDPYMTIFVRQALCIPPKPRPYSSAPSAATKVAADFKATIKGNRVSLFLRNMPKVGSFF